MNRLRGTHVKLTRDQYRYANGFAPDGRGAVGPFVRFAVDLARKILDAGGRRVVVTSEEGVLLESIELESYLAQKAPTLSLPCAIVDPQGNPILSDSSSYDAVISDVVSVSRELLRSLRSNPQAFFSLTPRQFEEVTAELLLRQGYSVELTPFTRDGGVDLFVARKEPLGSFLYIVECKRYSEDHPVGVELVRQLYGTVEEGRANAGILVTTSTFTAGAKEFQRSRAQTVITRLRRPPELAEGSIRP